MSVDVKGPPEVEPVPPDAAPNRSPVGEGVGPAGDEGSSNEEDEVVEKGKFSSDQDALLPIPPPVPKSGMSILTHKLWIGNLDRRLTE